MLQSWRRYCCYIFMNTRVYSMVLLCLMGFGKVRAYLVNIEKYRILSIKIECVLENINNDEPSMFPGKHFFYLYWAPICIRVKNFHLSLFCKQRRVQHTGTCLAFLTFGLIQNGKRFRKETHQKIFFSFICDKFNRKNNVLVTVWESRPSGLMVFFLSQFGPFCDHLY